MNVSLKKLSDQVVVITGVTSGIGLCTARLAAARGAKLVLAARGEDGLRQLVDEIERRGGQAIHVVADVGVEADVRRIGQAAIDRFGGFDTWINNAGISLVGDVTLMPVEDMRRLFDTNFWGVVHGSLVAAEHLRRRGGALINVGSELSDMAAPLQALYSASKHAVKGFTDSFRLELQKAGAPVSVTLVKPAGIDTMFAAHAKNFMDVEPSLPPPVYAPEVAADAILYAAEHPVRDMYAGGASKLFSLGARLMPGVSDMISRAVMFDLQRSDRPARPREDHALDRPGQPMQERQGVYPMVFEHSLYTQASKLPAAVTGLMALGVGLAAMAVMGRRPGLPPQRPLR